jgi:hypothetical protein
MNNKWQEEYIACFIIFGLLIAFSVFIPTVCLDVISLVASSCGYYRGQIEQHAAQ